jgi:hypothetical protein
MKGYLGNPGATAATIGETPFSFRSITLQGKPCLVYPLVWDLSIFTDVLLTAVLKIRKNLRKKKTSYFSPSQQNERTGT